jgi:penicillin-binding protein 2
MSREWNNKVFPTRRNIFLAGGGILFGGITLKLAELQLFRSGEFDQLAQDNHIRLEPAPPHRGTIYDRLGRPIASNKRTFYVTLTPEQVPGGAAGIPELVDRIASILSISDSARRRILREARNGKAFNQILVADDLSWEDFAKINARAPELAGVAAEVGEQRSYPFGAAFYHTVGYVGNPKDEEIAKVVKAEQEANREPADSDAGKARAGAIRRLYLHPETRVGKQGLEAYAEKSLKGTPGRTASLVNAGGRVIEAVPKADIPGKKGTDLVLALDAELQSYAIQRFGSESGAAVVLDIKTGEVLVMMSTPGPDPNQFVSGVSDEYWQTLREPYTEKAPLYHKAYEGIYPPGSTFKMIVAAAALESGTMTPEDRVHCSGGAFYYTRVYHCWKPEGHGSVNLHAAIQRSCDCYFYAAAQRTGIEKIAAMAKRLGYGHRYELGITGGNRFPEAPNDEWKRRRYKERWYDGDTISAGIGQGYVLMTPLMNAVMIARLAGGPATPRPKLVHDGVDVPDQTVEPMGDLSEKTLKAIRDGMFAVCCEAGGTAYSYLKGGGLDEKGDLPEHYRGAKVAGKSGSAQVRVIQASDRGARGKQLFKEESLPWKLRDHAHFVAYAPADNPRYACAITVEHGSHGSETAAPFARDILLQTLKSDPGNKPTFQAPRQVAATSGAKT